MKLPLKALVVLLLISLSNNLSAFDCDGIAAAPGEEITAEVVVSGLSSPVDIQAAPGDTSRLYIVEQRGRIRIINLANDSLVSRSFLDITSRVRSGGERGLLGLAFHPDFQTNGYFFVNYTNSGGTSVIARYRATSATTASSNTEQIVLTVSQPYSNHNAGQLAFSPRDGYLYIGFGDGGSGGDPGNRSQNGRQLLGKMLRIDVDGGDPYGIPADNPFTNNGSVRDELWAIGVRNPSRFSYAPETHDIYIGDVGQNAWEEIDFQPAT
ncbi:MAG: PQQ-dependent sugar dehydrogenase, partial [Planctomycetes bacterium]|nr:PQQ-dependent sugar dehydrogenase [Planctomycetota bacterium]